MSTRVRVTAVFAVVAFALTFERLALADKLDDIRARGYLLVGVTKDSPPFSFLGSDGTIIGYDVDLADEVARSLAASTKKVSIINADRVSFLQQDRVDLVKRNRFIELPWSCHSRIAPASDPSKWTDAHVRLLQRDPRSFAS